MMFNLCENIHEYGAIDMLDRLCEQLISASIVSNLSGNSATDPIETAVRQTASYIELHYNENISVNKLISEHKVSQASFLRRWKKLFGIPPSRYISKMKFEEAAHLLSETSMRINEIADKLNFDDPLYFSRKFRKETGYSPREYRELKKS
jgi:AraC-like DNA-binding protein